MSRVPGAGRSCRGRTRGTRTCTSSPTKRGGSTTGRGACCATSIPRPTCRCFSSASTRAAACRATSNWAASLPALRDRGVLILGSGNIVHNLRRLEGDKDAPPFPWTVEFDAKVKNAIETATSCLAGRARTLGQAAGGARPSHPGALCAAALLLGKHHRARRRELPLRRL